MKVSARSIKKNGKNIITIKKLGKQAQSHVAGTVVMSKVHFGKTLLGTVVEELEKAFVPRRDDTMFTRAVKNWDQARYIGSLGGYYNIRTGEKVESAEFVYMVGGSIYYTN